MKRKEIKRKMAESKYQEELMEAHMEEEKAMVSLSIYNEQDIDEKEEYGRQSFPIVRVQEREKLDDTILMTVKPSSIKYSTSVTVDEVGYSSIRHSTSRVNNLSRH